MVSYDGLDRLADQDLPLYQILAEQSQDQVLFTAHLRYGSYTDYHGVACIGVIAFKFYFCYYRDQKLASSRSHGHWPLPFLFDKLVIYSHLIGYCPTPKRLIAMFLFSASMGRLL